MNALSSLFGKRPLALKSNVRQGPNGQSYTPEEIRVAKIICKLALRSIGRAELTPEEEAANTTIIEVFSVVSSEKAFKDLALLMRGVYRQYETYVLCDPQTLEHFPYLDDQGERAKRNQSSVTVLLRTAIVGLVTNEERDLMFKMYQSAKVSNS